MAARSEAGLDRPWRRPGAAAYALTRLRGLVSPPVTVVEPAAGAIVVERDARILAPDGTTLRANVYRPPGGGRHPVIVSAHPYGKDVLPTRRARSRRWRVSLQFRVLRQTGPIAFSPLTSWEAPDPARWVEQGYAVVNADLRGAGRSDGVGKLLSREEGDDVAAIVEWAARQPWSNGRVGMNGVSYLALTQWRAASLRPPSLRAICPWEGFTDAYRDLCFPGGVREDGFIRLWERGLARVRLAYKLRADGQAAHPLHDAFWQSLVPDLAAIEVPLLVCGSFSDNNLHTRGAFRGFEQAGSSWKRLYTHRGGKWATFYTAEAFAEQLAFFDRFLKDDAPVEPSRSIRLEVREERDRVAEVREERSWPLERTQWTELHLGGTGPGALSLDRPARAGSIAFDTRAHGAAFSWVVPEEVELTGPMAARLWVSVDGADDVDLFVGVEKWRGGRFVPFEGSYGYGRDRVATGWQKASLRALDAAASRPHAPVPACTRRAPLQPGEVVQVDVALGPSSTLFRAGEELRLVVAGRWLSPRNPVTGQFPAAYPGSPRGRATLHWDPDRPARLLVPKIPRG